MSWIKMRTNLLTHPKVVSMALAMKQPTWAVVGALYAVWSIADTHTEDGRLGMSSVVLDATVACPGISEAMLSVGWLSKDGATLAVPAFDTHNSRSAKARAAEAVRSSNRRSGTPRPETDRLFPVDSRSEPGPREEKRREEERKTKDSARDEEPEGFQTFWKNWPSNDRKVNRRDCLRRWLTNDLERIASAVNYGLEQAKKSRTWVKDGGEFIPQPATWLNQRRWEAFAPARTAQAQKPLTPWQRYDELSVQDRTAIEIDVSRRFNEGSKIERIAANMTADERRRSPHWTDAIAAAMKARGASS